MTKGVLTTVYQSQELTQRVTQTPHSCSGGGGGSGVQGTFWRKETTLVSTRETKLGINTGYYYYQDKSCKDSYYCLVYTEGKKLQCPGKTRNKREVPVQFVLAKKKSLKKFQDEQREKRQFILTVYIRVKKIPREKTKKKDNYIAKIALRMMMFTVQGEQGVRVSVAQ